METPQNGNAHGLAVEVPAIELGNVTLRVASVPGHPELRQLVIGPVFFTVPLDEVARRAVVHGLTGIVPATRMDIPGE